MTEHAPAEDAAQPPDEYAQLVAANAARRAYLTQHGAPPPADQLYLVSLLEFVLGDEIPRAQLFHERRMARVLDDACSRLVQIEDARGRQQRVATLLGRN